MAYFNANAFAVLFQSYILFLHRLVKQKNPCPEKEKKYDHALNLVEVFGVYRPHFVPNKFMVRNS